MPNHVKNVVHFTNVQTTKEREALTKLLVNPQGVADFNLVKPMPEVLVGTTANFKKDLDPQQAKALEETGHKDWYSWSNAEWGTKWNAYSNNQPYEMDSLHRVRTGAEAEAWTAKNVESYNKAVLEQGTREHIEFDTAWGAPWEVYDQLAKDNPDVSFTVTYSDEDVPHGSGKACYRDGVMDYMKSYSHNTSTKEERENYIIRDNAMQGEDMEGAELDEDYEIVKTHDLSAITNVFTNDADRHPNLRLELDENGLTHESRVDRKALRRTLLRTERILPWLTRKGSEELLTSDDDPTLAKGGVCIYSALESVAHAVEAYHTIASYRRRGLNAIEEPNIELIDGSDIAAYHLVALVSDLLRADVIRLHDVDYEVFDYLNDLPDVPTVIVIESHERQDLFWEMLEALQDDKDVFLILRDTKPTNTKVKFPINVKLIGDHVQMK